MTVTLLGATEIRRLAAELDVTPTKKLGQNFVVDANTVRKIVHAADVQPGERVVEIGPGLGSLTLAILEAGAAVTAVEIDHRLAERLPQTALERGVPEGALTVVESYEHLPTSGGSGADVALEANPRITALMCTADVLALSAMDRLRARGVYVPGQMTVTGFDGVPEALSRGLTTVRQPSIEKGRRAGELLHNPPRSGLPAVEVLDTELVRGRTSGPPA